MNSNGLIFTLEVMIAIIILAVAIGVVLSSSYSPEENQTGFIIYQNQSERIISVYFDKSSVSGTGNNIICGDFFKYNNLRMTKENICEGYE